MVTFPLQVLHELAMDFIIPNLDDVWRTEEYQNMAEDLLKQLIQELADKGIFVGLKRRRME